MTLSAGPPSPPSPQRIMDSPWRMDEVFSRPLGFPDHFQGYSSLTQKLSDMYFPLLGGVNLGKRVLCFGTETSLYVSNLCSVLNETTITLAYGNSYRRGFWGVERLSTQETLTASQVCALFTVSVVMSSPCLRLGKACSLPCAPVCVGRAACGHYRSLSTLRRCCGSGHWCSVMGWAVTLPPTNFKVTIFGESFIKGGIYIKMRASGWVSSITTSS